MKQQAVGEGEQVAENEKSSEKLCYYLQYKHLETYALKAGTADACKHSPYGQVP